MGVKKEEIYRKTPNAFGSLNVNVDDYDENELLSFLVTEYYVASHFTRPAINATDESHIFEYCLYIGNSDKGKLIGYITKDRIIFRDKSYSVVKDDEGVAHLSKE